MHGVFLRTSLGLCSYQGRAGGTADRWADEP